MGALFVFAAFVVLGVCLAEDKRQRRRFLGGVVVLLYLPIGILLALTKKYK